MKNLAACFLAATLLTACGSDDEEPLSARDRCADQSYFVSGQLSVPGEDGEDLVFPFENSGSIQNGAIRGSEIILGVGELPRADDAPPLILKFRENVAESDPLDVVTNAVSEGPLTVTVADGTGVSNEVMRRSDLSLIEGCGIPNGSICAQVALDTTENGAVSDDDEKVFAASGGEVRFVDVDNVASRMKLDFTIELGRNVLTTGDESTGSISGCINAAYDRSGGGSGWVLR